MKFCKNCGKQLEDNTQFCPECGTNQIDVVEAVPKVKESVWDGGVFDTLVAIVATSLIITFTCGIATPWAICYMMRFIIGHAVIDGKRLKFTGTGGSLIGNWLLWLLLSIITCGIYLIWVVPNVCKWVASHIHSEG